MGNAASVLVGDFLYSKSFKLMTDHGNPAILKLLSTTTNTMSEGEVFQLMKAGDVNLNEKEYLLIVEKKTSILISAACAIGGILGNASDGEVEALTRFGMRLGTAFQITDDTLDYVAREEEFGKAIGQDLKEGKLTLPLIRTMKKCNPEERAFIRKGIEEKNEEATAEIMALIGRYGGIDYALAKAKACIDEARGFMAGFEDSEAKTGPLEHRRLHHREKALASPLPITGQPDTPLRTTKRVRANNTTPKAKTAHPHRPRSGTIDPGPIS
jgi:octaprenyl-diphosphate synthase